MNEKAVKLGLWILVMVGVVGILVLTFQRPANLYGAVIEPPLQAPDFTLTRHDGSEFRLSQYQGKIVLLFFGYTSCPDVCPATMGEMRQARAALSPESAEQVQIVFVAVDPDRDTPDRIQEYANHFDSSFIGLSGSIDELQPIWDAYGVVRQIEESQSASGYLVTHTARVYLVDKAGNLRTSYAFGTFPDDVTHDLRILVKE